MVQQGDNVVRGALRGGVDSDVYEVVASGLLIVSEIHKPTMKLKNGISGGTCRMADITISSYREIITDCHWITLRLDVGEGPSNPKYIIEISG